MPPFKIYVGNLPPQARSSDLRELFEKFGRVVECDILKDYGFVHMDYSNDGKAAIAGLNDTYWKGARIRVAVSTTRTHKGEPSVHRAKRRRDYTPERSKRNRSSRSRRSRSRSRSRNYSPPPLPLHHAPRSPPSPPLPPPPPPPPHHHYRHSRRHSDDYDNHNDYHHHHSHPHRSSHKERPSRSPRSPPTRLG